MYSTVSAQKLIHGHLTVHVLPFEVYPSLLVLAECVEPQYTALIDISATRFY
jgi:hypothetical protein